MTNILSIPTKFNVGLKLFFKLICQSETVIITLISSFLEIDFEINISDKKSRRFDLSEVYKSSLN